MGIFGKWRGNPATEISQPTLTFTDAAPRDDLHRLGQLKSPDPRNTGLTSPTTTRKMKEFQDAAKAFDFTVTEPPERLEAEGSFDDTDGGCMIGIALGSPSMLPPPPSPPRFKPVEWDSITTNATTETPEALSTLRRKPSKWKKLGGLFKGKQGERKGVNEPFYQLDMNIQAPHQDLETQTRDTSQQTQFPKVENDMALIEPNPYYMGNQQKPRNNSLLEIDIPAVEMERYSVMFSGVLGKKPDTSLLARRNKALDDIKVQTTENEYLKPYRPRRATSPGPASPPSFALFPDSASNFIEKDQNTNEQPALKSPRRSNTFPSEAPTSNGQSNTLTVPDLTPALSSSTSADPSPLDLSPTTMEVPLVSRIVPTPVKSHVQEPTCEMITMKTDSTTSTAPPSSHVSSKPTQPNRSEYVTANSTPTYPVHAGPMFPPRSSSHENDVLAERPHRSRAQTMPTPLKIKKSQSPAPKPNVVISTARSVSVSRRGTRAPLARPSADHLDSSNERFGEHQKLTPQVVDIRRGYHHHKKSENAVIESL
ncbi:Pc12g14000 [Talaromyces islandicus]|uniref:Pc12g14000 n=1 Tax=Talaromyces islandicus TaxID=28573 RepID=A0A0U1LZ61_TALIS|nr:Pc12g14000 [Talaromyces islandicus]